MRAVIQRVSQAAVEIDGLSVGNIGRGLVVLLGIDARDDSSDVDWLIAKICNMRIFSDADGKMNTALQEAGGSMLVISQFTLHASTKKGNRPSFIKAARPEQAIPLYELFVAASIKAGVNTQTGVFGADMQVKLVNDGPVTIIIDSHDRQ